MSKQEIEEIIRKYIRPNGHGEITAKVMAGVLEAFVSYTDSEEDKFAELCRELAAAFAALVEDMEGKFENKADALEAALELFCTNLLNNEFVPWAEGLSRSLSDKMDLTKGAADDAKTASLDAKSAAEGAYTKAGEAKTAAQDAADKSLQAKTAADTASSKSDAAKTAADGAKAAIDEAADGVDEALEILRGIAPFMVPSGVKFGGSSVTEFPASMDFSDVHDGNSLFQGCSSLQKAPAVSVSKANMMFQGCSQLTDVDDVVIDITDTLNDNNSIFASCMALQTVPEGVLTLRGFSASLFQYCMNLRSVHIKFGAGGVMLQQAFASCGMLTTLTVDVSELGPNDTVSLTPGCFTGCGSLTALPTALLENASTLTLPPQMYDLQAFDASKLDNWQALPYLESGSLMNVGLITNLNPSVINLSGYAMLTLQSVKNIVAGLVDISGSEGKNITFSSQLQATISADTTDYGGGIIGVVNYAASKGWTINYQ